LQRGSPVAEELKAFDRQSFLNGQKKQRQKLEKFSNLFLC